MKPAVTGFTSPEVLEEKRRAIITRAVEAAEKILNALIDEAVEGNVAAAKLILQVAGLLYTGSITAVRNDVTLSAEEIERIVREIDKEMMEDA